MSWRCTQRDPRADADTLDLCGRGRWLARSRSLTLSREITGSSFDPRTLGALGVTGAKRSPWAWPGPGSSRSGERSSRSPSPSSCRPASRSGSPAVPTPTSECTPTGWCWRSVPAAIAATVLAVAVVAAWRTTRASAPGHAEQRARGVANCRARGHASVSLRRQPACAWRANRAGKLGGAGLFRGIACGGVRHRGSHRRARVRRQSHALGSFTVARRLDLEPPGRGADQREPEGLVRGSRRPRRRPRARRRSRRRADHESSDRRAAV